MMKINTKIEAINFARNNYDGVLGFLSNSDDDYVAARCCILNGLSSGFVLASQSIERTLKAFIYIETGQKKKGHNPYTLKEELKRLNDYHLDDYNNELKKLSDHYLGRYHDDRSLYGTNGSSTEELVVIDKLWLDLKDKLTIPDEVKYRTKFFCDICEPDKSTGGFWLMKDNYALTQKLPFYKTKYDKVVQKLYPGKH